MRLAIPIAVLSAYSLPALASELNTSQSMQAFTGLFNTPHAEVTDYGMVELGYSPYFDSAIARNPVYRESTNLKAFFGLMPNLEVSARLATVYWHRNCFTEGCEFRDLSFSAKYEIPFIPEEWLTLAVGGQDVGGSAVQSEGYYGVASKQLGDVRLSLGYGTSESKLDWINGPFGGVEWQPLDWLQLIAEYDANAINGGAKLITPEGWLWEGWSANLAIQAYSSEARNDKDIWVGGSVSLPLTLGHSPGRYQRGWPIEEAAMPRPLSGSDMAGSRQPAEALVDIAPTSTPRQIQQQTASKALQAALVEHGFEDVAIARDDSTLTLQVENQIYNWNALDAIGVVFGLASEYAEPQQTIRLILTRFHQPIVQLEAQSDCLRQWLDGQHTNCHGSQLFAISTRQFDVPETWDQPLANSSRFVPRIILAPALQTMVGTEWGALDYSLALSSNLQLSPWQGGVIDVRHLLPIANTDDFEDGERFGNMRINNEVDRILLHQALRLPYGLFTKFSAGRVRGDYDGVLNETVWQSQFGRHKLKFEAGHFENDASTTASEPLLGRYRYFREDLDWAMEVTGGQFWNNDEGFKIESQHWFGDTKLTVQVRETEDRFASMTISFPLTPRKDMRANTVQVRGIEQWSYGLETTLGFEGGNMLRFGQGITPGFYHNIDQVYFNRDRLSPAYIQANLARMLEAYQRYVGKVGS